jgi:SAM-dependent methyltransferase
MSEGHWQLEGNAAELFQRYLVPAITSKWAEDLVRRAQLRTGELVLDVACGTGIVARLAATKVRPGQVTGLDLNAGMLAVARSLPNDGAPINWTEGSAVDMPFPSGHFDVVLCQQGLQFFPDQPGALRELHRVLRKGGRAALSVYSPIERTPGANAFVQALDQVLGPEASRIKRGEHSFANPGQLESLLGDGGFGNVVVSTVQQTIVFPSVLDYVRLQLVATPMTMLLKKKPSPSVRRSSHRSLPRLQPYRVPQCSMAAGSRSRRRRTSLLRGLLTMQVDGPSTIWAISAFRPPWGPGHQSASRLVSTRPSSTLVLRRT